MMGYKGTNVLEELDTWSRGHLERVECCPACGSRVTSGIFRRHDDNRTLNDVWTMKRCSGCGSLYLDPRPDADSLPRAYAEYFTHEKENEDAPQDGTVGFVWTLVNGYLNSRFSMNRKPSNVLGAVLFPLIEPWRLKLDYYGRHLTCSHFPDKGRLLDVGCGNGAFLKRAQGMGWQVSGVDPDPAAVETCSALDMQVVMGDISNVSLRGKQFDVITMSHCLEHVQEPEAVLAHAYDLLVPGGMLWIALPNPGSLGFRLFHSCWRDLHPPFHLCIPSRRVLCSWLLGRGFKRIRLLRRGAHARACFGDSIRIVRREQPDARRIFRARWLRVATDLLATVSSRWAEETVVIAFKDTEVS